MIFELCYTRLQQYERKYDDKRYKEIFNFCYDIYWFAAFTVLRNLSRKALYVIAQSAVSAHAGTIYSGLGDKHANTNPPIEAVEGILSTQLIVCYLARACTECSTAVQQPSACKIFKT